MEKPSVGREGQPSPPDLLREKVLMARAQRRLVEFELVRRAVLLALAILCAVIAVIGVVAGKPLLTAACLCSGATLVRKARGTPVA